MSAVTCPSEAASPAAHIRARGEVRARFEASGGRTALASLYESGGYRLRLPRVPRGALPGCEGVLINTGGGMVGGDRTRLAFAVGEHAAVTLTTQSAEKVYRSDGADAEVETALTLRSGAWLEWLPQQTILFDAARLKRRVEADMMDDARLTLVESVVFGRLAMGEEVRRGVFRDSWRVRRGGRLAFADVMSIEGDIAAALDRPAIGAGARATALVLHVAPDAESRLDEVRAALAGSACESGASAWNGLLVARALSPSPGLLRAAIVAVLATLRGPRGAARLAMSPGGRP